MPFQPGQSGNPKGRPTKERALTTLLEQAGNATVDADGKRVAGKRLIAQLAWELATTGSAVMPKRPGTKRGRVLTVDSAEWVGLVKWLYSQIDGPPKATSAVEMSGPDGGPIEVDDASLDDDERLRRITALLERARARRVGPAAAEEPA